MYQQYRLVVLILLVSATIGADVGCFMNTHWTRTVNFDLSPREELTNTIYEGVNMVIDKKDGGVSMYLRTKGCWQPWTIRTFGRFIKKGDVLLNLGCHIGL